MYDKRFTLRLQKNIFDDMIKAVHKHYEKEKILMSTNSWVLQAIKEKIERDKKG